MADAKVIAVAQQKGGAGKTTLAINLAVYWALSGKRVAAVDIDPQQSLATWFSFRTESGRPALSGLTVDALSGWRTRGEVEKLTRSSDIVLIDTPPHAETEARIAVRAADLVVVPVQPSPMDVWASRPTVDLAESEGSRVLFVVNRVPPRANLTEAMLSEIGKLGAKVAKGRLGNRVLFASALAEGRSVSEASSSSLAAKEIEALAAEILRAIR